MIFLLKRSFFAGVACVLMVSSIMVGVSGCDTPVPVDVSEPVEEEQAQEEERSSDRALLAEQPFTEEEFERFVKIAAHLQVMRQAQEVDLKDELDSMGTLEEFQALHERVMGMVMEKVEEGGMDFETFMAIDQRVEADLELQELVIRRIQGLF